MMKPFGKSITAILCYVLLISMALPWVDMFGLHSGFLINELVKILDLSLVNLLYLVPVSAVAILVLGFGVINNPREKIRILKWVPAFVMLLLTLTMLNEVEFKFEKFFNIMSYGYYLVFLASSVLAIRDETDLLSVTDLTDTTRTKSNIRAENPAKFCPSCGSKLSSESVFCGECGKTL